MSTSAFALCARRLVKLTPGVNFTNILRATFAPKSPNLKCKYKKLLTNLLYEKGVHKMMAKLTPQQKFHLISCSFP
jgi:hypothetical protein